jgi:MFS family permease
MIDTAQAASPRPSSTRAAKPVFSQGYKTLVLAFLLLAYTFNFIDRTIIATIGQAIKVDLKITDTQLGLLGGLSFAVLYTLLGIPIARLAERWNRVSIISLALVVWSGFTVACGFAGNFISLLAMRVGVGVGEAGCSPPSHSLISDYFEPKRRASALSIYAFGIPLGSMIGAVAGGWLAKTYGWRVAFMVVGAPGLILALLVKLVVKEPPRGHSDPVERPVLPEDVPPEAVAAPAGGWMWTEMKELGAVTRDLFSHWPVLNMVLGVTLTSVAGYGVGQFSSPYFIRAFALDYATVGLVFLGRRHPGGRVHQRLGEPPRRALVRPHPGHRPRHRHADLRPRLSGAGLASRRADPASAGHLPLHLPGPDLRRGAERRRDPPPSHGDRGPLPVPQHHRARRRAPLHRVAHRPVRAVRFHSRRAPHAAGPARHGGRWPRVGALRHPLPRRRGAEGRSAGAGPAVSRGPRRRHPAGDSVHHRLLRLGRLPLPAGLVRHRAAPGDGGGRAQGAGGLTRFPPPPPRGKAGE